MHTKRTETLNTNPLNMILSTLESKNSEKIHQMVVILMYKYIVVFKFNL